MQCQILISGKNTKNSISLSSAEFTHSTVSGNPVEKVNPYLSQFVLILVNSFSSIWSVRTHLVSSS